MGRSTIAYLLLTSSLLLYITSCKSLQSVTGEKLNADCAKLINSRITTSTYNTQMDFWGRHLSGLLIFKAITDTTERAVFITETGFKFFDFEFTPHSFQVIYCLPALNKRIVTKTLQRDISFFIKFKDEATGIKQTSIDGNSYKVLYSDVQSNFYFTDKNCSTLKRINRGTDTHKSISCTIDSFQSNAFIQMHLIDHPAHLNISMRQIKK